MTAPTEPKIYHIVHVDRLHSIITDEFLWCDTVIAKHPRPGTAIGMNHIKQRRLKELTLVSHPKLYVGDCVPFNFCPRSVMLYVISRGDNPYLNYRDGQNPIVHLEADLRQTVDWAEKHNKRWAFTLSNAASRDFEDRCDLAQLDEIKWNAIQNDHWGFPNVDPSVQRDKQAEFLIERKFPWELVSRIGVHSRQVYQQVTTAQQNAIHKPVVEIKGDWYYG